MMNRLNGTLLAILLIFIVGCQGRPKQRPPIHVNPNMDWQPKFEAQEANPMFDNDMAMRLPVPGTVARGQLQEDSIFFTGIDPASGKPAATNPVPVSMSNLQRGRERFNIYCAVCHGQTGNGRGIMIQRGYVPPPDFHTDLVRNYPDGHLFGVITNGIRNMPSYRQQVPVEDRWKIIAYLRALQRSQNASAEDVPPHELERLR